MNTTETQEVYMLPGSSNASEKSLIAREQTLCKAYQQRVFQQTDRMFACLMVFQWLAAVAAALWLSPKTWAGPVSQTHLHVWSALFLGGLITFYPVFLALTRPGATLTRHTIAAGQLLMSALLIHLMGGRIETHFHVFGSLAFLAFYRDWKVILTGTLVTAADHALRGFLWPLSIYGVQSHETWRWLEHAGWVVFEDVFLMISCQSSLRELRGICYRDASLEESNRELEQKVEKRTAALQEANARLEALATTDPLTGLQNPRAIVAALDQELERSQRYGRSCALLFLDIDHFKALNDGFGHAAGDSALHEFGNVTRQCLRGIDTLGRWGGEEFVALLPETDEATALEIAERVRAAVAAHSFSAGGGAYVTCSLGVAVYPDDADSLSELVEAADKAMYAAKRLGRNQARSINDPLLQTLDSETESSREELALQGAADALARLVEARDAYTSEHTEGVGAFAVRIAQALELDAPQIRLIGLVGKLHDIGKVAIPDAILQKPGSLTEEEWVLMRTHPIIGADVVSRIPALRIAAPGIRGHHERWDGKGYPDGLAGAAIPLAARIVTVADSYNAMTTDRPYRRARSAEEALEELRRCTGAQFDPTVMDALERMISEDAARSVYRKAA